MSAAAASRPWSSRPQGTLAAGSAERRYHARVPTLRPFRALRFDSSAGDLSDLVAPPYDIISPAQRQALLARDAHNIVRVELPGDLGSATPEDYAAAAGSLADWQRDGILVRDAQPTVTIHRMRWQDADGRPGVATGVFAQLRLEPFGPGGGVLPHERTMGGPKLDRMQLLEATRTNTSPVVLLADADPAPAAAALERLTAAPPDAVATTDDGVSHELWICPGEWAADLLAALAAAPLTIADGHHRYETALAWRDAHAGENDAAVAPAGEWLLVLVYPIDQAPPALPTHRVIRGRPCGDDLVARLASWARLEALPDDATLLARMAQPPEITPGAIGSGRIGLLTGDSPSLLWLDAGAVAAALPSGLSAASRGLDVVALTAMLDHAFGAEPGTLADEGRLWYVKDAREAVHQVVHGTASAAFLLDGVPAAAITAVARATELMPHKSTYFHPKAPSGLLLGPLGE